jgi:hypothetical protein
MTRTLLADLLRHVRTLPAAAPAPPEGSDCDLLRRFAAGNDPGAFVALVRRHGPLVLRVCRRVLGHEQDAEDAFQATFLVLAKKAATIRSTALLLGLPAWKKKCEKVTIAGVSGARLTLGWVEQSRARTIERSLSRGPTLTRRRCVRLAAARRPPASRPPAAIGPPGRVGQRPRGLLPAMGDRPLRRQTPVPGLKPV